MKTSIKLSSTLWHRPQLWLLISSVAVIMAACSSESIDNDSLKTFPVAEAIDLGLPSGTKSTGLHRTTRTTRTSRLVSSLIQTTGIGTTSAVTTGDLCALSARSLNLNPYLRVS